MRLDRYGGARAKRRRGSQPHQDRSKAGSDPRHQHRHGGADLVLGCDLVVSGTPRSSRPSGRAKPASSSTTPRSIPAISPATPISRCRSTRSGRRSRKPPAGTPPSAMRPSPRWPLRHVDRGQHLSRRLCLAEGASAASEDALLRAIEIIDESVEMNKRAFLWGRREAAEPARVELAGAKLDPSFFARDVGLVRRAFQPPPGLPHRLSESRLCRLICGHGKRVIEAENALRWSRRASRQPWQRISSSLCR